VANDDKWALQDALPDGLDETKAVRYRQVEQVDVVLLGGELYLFKDGQVWWRQPDGRWQRSVFTPADLDSSTFERVTA
jgi:hypothetical protein